MISGKISAIPIVASLVLVMILVLVEIMENVVFVGVNHSGGGIVAAMTVVSVYYA